jgi:ubiquinone/menaquinone biosynthesis C-methylase UbiE
MKNIDQPSQTPNLVRPERYKHIDDAIRYHKQIRPASAQRRLSHWMEMRAFKRAIARIKGRDVLDGPCGTGRIYRILSSRFSTVVSLDSSESMLHVHRHIIGSEGLCCADIFHLPFPDNLFDWTISYRLFHHLQTYKDRVELINSISRVSRQGVIFTAWVDTPLNRREGSRRSSLARSEIEEAISEANLGLAHMDYAFWPFQPKCVITCKKPGH